MNLAIMKKVVKTKIYKKRLLLFGASNFGMTFYSDFLLPNEIDIIGFLDNDKRKLGSFLCERPIMEPDVLLKIEFDYVLITSQFAGDILNQLLKLGIKRDAIIIISPQFLARSKIWPTVLFFRFSSFFRRSGIRSNTEEVIISLTTIPSRVETLWICIESLLRQDFKPSHIILWLSKEEFKNIKLPPLVLKQQKRGLQIRYCENLKSHKKYYYSMLEFPNSTVVTVDDDVIYPQDMLERLMKKHYQYPGKIICNRAHKIQFNDNNELKSYNHWSSGATNFRGPSHLLLPTGVSGVLYPPASLHKEVFNKDIFMTLCPTQDDLWLKVMAFKKNTKVVKVEKYSRNFIEIDGTQNNALWKDNALNGLNDVGFIKLLDEYKITFNPDVDNGL